MHSCLTISKIKPLGSQDCNIIRLWLPFCTPTILHRITLCFLLCLFPPPPLPPVALLWWLCRAPLPQLPALCGLRLADEPKCSDAGLSRLRTIARWRRWQCSTCNQVRFLGKGKQMRLESSVALPFRCFPGWIPSYHSMQALLPGAGFRILRWTCVVLFGE